MYVIDLPCTTSELADLDRLTLPHDLLRLEVGLEPGQLLFGQDLEGRYWGVEVLGAFFNRQTTRYRLRIGETVDRSAVALLARDRLSAGRHGAGDISDALRALGQLARVPA